MQRDFSIWQRAEDTWQEARRSAAEQRLARQAEARHEAAAPRWARLRAWLATGALRAAVRRAVGMLAVLVMLNALAGVTQAAPPLQGVRALVENVLGPGTVKSVRMADAGTTVMLVWESATYKPANRLALTRELLYAEAALATGAVMGPLWDLRRVRFSIVRGTQLLASGETGRARPLIVAFGAALGGGTYVAGPVPVRPVVPGGGWSAQEL
jgi:hypothetical protein